jgi:hypothetical protein
MELKTIHCFLVHPAKREETQPDIGGTSVPKKGLLYSMLKGIFDKSEEDCRTDISFNHNATGKQQNDCRDLLLAYINSHRVDDGRSIALRLQAVTTHKSGLGLLFLMVGNDGDKSKLVLSRFPADQGILAEESKDSLTVEFLEKVFMKSATAYKSALYEGKPTANAFWTGRATDKQINNPGHEFANYWIRDFLSSELRTTSAAGSRRLAQALRVAMQNLSETEAKSEIAAAVTLITGIDGKTTSVEAFCDHFGLSSKAIDAVRKAIKHDNLMSENFQFDAVEFKRHIAFRSVELSNGGILTADASQFDNIFHREDLKLDKKEVRFTTQGKIVDQRLRKGKI